MECLSKFRVGATASGLALLLWTGAPAVGQESGGASGQAGGGQSQQSGQTSDGQQDQPSTSDQQSGASRSQSDSDQYQDRNQEQSQDRNQRQYQEQYQERNQLQDQLDDQRRQLEEQQQYDQYERDGEGRTARSTDRGRSGQWDDRSQSGQWDDQQRGQYDESDAGALGVLLDSRDPVPRVDRVYRGTPADRAGIRPGDEILAIDGERVDSARQLAQRVRQMNPGDRVEVFVRRNGQQRTVDVRLAEREETFDGRSPVQDRFRDQAGYYGQQRGQYERGDQSQPSQIRQELDDLQRQLQRLAGRVEDLRARLDGGYRSSQQSRDYGVNQAGYYDGRSQNFTEQQSRSYQGQQFDDGGYRSQPFNQPPQYGDSNERRGFSERQSSWSDSQDPSRALQGASGRDTLRSRTSRVND